MKVLHVAQSLMGGPASYFDEIIPHQVKIYGERNVSLLVPDQDLQYLSADTLAAKLYTFPSRSRSIGALIQFAARVMATLRAIRPDIVHFHSTYAGAIGRPLAALCGRNCKVVYCAHGWAFDMSGGGYSQVVIAIERFLARITDAIVNISEADMASAERRGIGVGKSVAIRNGIQDIPPPHQSRSERQIALGFDTSKVNVLFVGRFDEQKGADIAMATASMLPPERYHLYAIGDVVVSGNTHQGVVPKNVTRLGWLSRAEIVKYYEAADVVIMPSRWEGFGLVAIESMRSGTPVLGAAVGALPELIDDGAVGRLVAPGRAEPFAEILTNTSQTEWTAMGTRARAHFQRNFTADRLNAGLDELYRQLYSFRRPAKVLA